jgi:uncharacterized protein (DUF2235 family)
MANGAGPQPKTIVLLSDGTGNSSAKLFKTNVWRIYEGLDLSHPDQVAYYDNGVGTSSFKPLALVGGAFGWGLKRNVRDLYTFLCRNYRQGDRIFVFGFSRGAFTVRVLVGLIDSQGVIVGEEGSELSRLVAWAFRQYRRRYNVTGGLVTPIRVVRDWLLRVSDRLRGLKPYAKAQRVTKPPIAFVGVWDTVDAYGLPMDELTRGWDQWVWPLSMRDRMLSPLVEKACHVLSLDDERHTFHPLLWTEAGQSPASHIDHERISQVWFAGVHSNVGGGYPDDSLAHVSLLWMAEQAAKLKLRIHQRALDEWSAKANLNGPIYDSRRGLGGYYRYRPRSIAALADDSRHDVRVDQPKIHESVFDRIRAGTDGYAPIVLPEGYAVVTAKGSIVTGQSNPWESPTQALSRVNDQAVVWNVVWWRRVVYFATVLASLGVLVRPFVPGVPRWLLDAEVPLVSGVIGMLGSALPDLARPWLSWYQTYPLHLLAGGILVAALLYAGGSLEQTIVDRMRTRWQHVVTGGPRAVTPSPVSKSLLFRFRTSPAYVRFFDVLTWRLLPFGAGFGALCVLVLLVVAVLGRVVFDAASVAGQVCREDASAQPARTLVVGGLGRAELAPTALCSPTNILIERGATYRVNIDLPTGDIVWRDGRYEVTTPAGVAVRPRPVVFYLGLPFRRSLSWNWFVPIARVGATGAEYHGLPAASNEFIALTSGRLFLYVNDAVLPWPFWTALYANNSGAAAAVTVERVR